MERQNLHNGDSIPKPDGSAPNNGTRPSKVIENDKQAQRLIRGMKIALDGRVKRVSNSTNGYQVTGDSGREYFVPESFDSCPCPDEIKPCKHVWAVRVYEYMDRKVAELGIDIEARYRSETQKLEEKLRSIAEQNLKLRLQVQAFEQLKEGFKQLLKSL